MCSSDTERCVNRTTAFDATGRSFVNVAEGRPTLSSSSGIGSSLSSSAGVDGVYSLSEWFFTSHEGLEVVPLTVSAGTSSDVAGGIPATRIEFAAPNYPVAKEEWGVHWKICTATMIWKSIQQSPM